MIKVLFYVNRNWKFNYHLDWGRISLFVVYFNYFKLIKNFFGLWFVIRNNTWNTFKVRIRTKLYQIRNSESFQKIALGLFQFYYSCRLLVLVYLSQTKSFDSCFDWNENFPNQLSEVTKIRIVIRGSKAQS